MRATDILDAIDRIKQYTLGMDFEQFRQDQKTVDAVIRNFEIIGEAANFIPISVQERLAEIPWSKMRGIRNIIAHEYFGVSLVIIWQTIQFDLDPIISTLQKERNQNTNQIE